MNEAFKAGNRARKKESVSDAVADMHNPLQDQIDRFREQTGIELGIKDGRPYYIGQYAAGKQVGTWEFYDPDGNLAGTKEY